MAAEDKCPRCDGAGVEPGSGDYDHAVHMVNPMTQEPCSVCHGTSAGHECDCDLHTGDLARLRSSLAMAQENVRAAYAERDEMWERKVAALQRAGRAEAELAELLARPERAEGVVARVRELRDQWALASTSIHESLAELARIETYAAVVANLDIALEGNGAELLARLRAAQEEANDAAEVEASETVRAEDAEAERDALKAEVCEQVEKVLNTAADQLDALPPGGEALKGPYWYRQGVHDAADLLRDWSGSKIFLAALDVPESPAPAPTATS
jgi:hypothetical protein